MQVIAAIFLKAKCYALLVDPDDDQLAFEIRNKKKHGFTLTPDENGDLEGILTRAKGVVQSESSIKFDDYYITHKDNTKKIVQQRKMQTKNHQIHWTDQTRVAFDSFDDKRFVLDCQACSKAYGSVQNMKYDGACNCNGFGK